MTPDLELGEEEDSITQDHARKYLALFVWLTVPAVSVTMCNC